MSNKEKELTFLEAYSLLSSKIKWAIFGFFILSVSFSVFYFGWQNIFWSIVMFLTENSKTIQTLISFFTPMTLIWYFVQNSKISAFIKVFFPKHLKDMEGRIMAKIEQVEQNAQHIEQVHEENLASNFMQLKTEIKGLNAYVVQVDRKMQKDVPTMKRQIRELEARQSNLEGQNEANKETHRIMLEILSKNSR